MMKKQKLALYIHIPFCVKKCNYCDFLSYTADEEQRDIYVQALLREIESYRGSEYVAREIVSLFIGGGTPSLLTDKQMVRIFDKIKSVFNFENIQEISIEINPGTITESGCRTYRECGISRISIGLQSTRDEELKRLGRIHDYRQFLQSYHMLRDAGFANINIDIMSGLPGQSLNSYCEGLEKVLKLKPEHISAYSLIIEEGTPFYEKYHNRCDLLPDEETDRSMYRRTGELLTGYGYKRYEISNYALPGYACLHNQVYWQRGEYLGMGLGSSSYINHARFKNTDSPAQYIKLCGEELGGATPNRLATEVCYLKQKEEMEEFMFLGLRRMEGISFAEFDRQFGQSLRQVYGEVIDRYVQSGHLIMYEKSCAAMGKNENKYLALTDRGIDVSNYIFEDFLLS